MSRPKLRIEATFPSLSPTDGRPTDNKIVFHYPLSSEEISLFLGDPIEVNKDNLSDSAKFELDQLAEKIMKEILLSNISWSIEK